MHSELRKGMPFRQTKEKRSDQGIMFRREQTFEGRD